MSLARVLVHLKSDVKPGLVTARFSQCLMEYLQLNDSGNVCCYLEQDKLVLYTSPGSGQDHVEEIVSTVPISGDTYKLQHPPFCPFASITDEEKADIPLETRERGVDVAVAVILCTLDQHVLLTRRSQHMRTFPGVWVPPGGHVELGETLAEAGLRELKEETGLAFHPNMIHSSILCLWESVYPPLLPLGLPKRHHAVVYLVLSPNAGWKELQKDIKLDPEEVEACVWLSKDMIKTIIDGDKREFSTEHNFTVVSPDGQQEDHLFDPNLLYILNRASGFDIPRVSTGSKFALIEWLNQVELPVGKYKL